MKKLILLAAAASITACSSHHLASTDISDLDQVRTAIQQSKDAGAEKCAPQTQAKAVAYMYHAAHEITDERGYHADEDAALVASALKYAKQAEMEAKQNCAPKPAPVVVAKPEPKPVVYVAPKPMILEVIRLKGVYFNTNSAELKSSDSAPLDEAAAIMKKRPDIHVEIAAYTDNTGKASYNLALSKKRAKTAKDYLIAHGIDAARLTAKGYGIVNPVATNKTRVGRAENRRVEMHVMK